MLRQTPTYLVDLSDSENWQYKAVAEVFPPNVMQLLLEQMDGDGKVIITGTVIPKLKLCEVDKHTKIIN